MKDGYEATRIVVETLRKSGTPHMVVGGLSSNAYGIPRSTKDADIVLAVDGKLLFEMAATLGPEFQLDDQASFEMVTDTLRYHLRVPSKLNSNSAPGSVPTSAGTFTKPSRTPIFLPFGCFSSSAAAVVIRRPAAIEHMREANQWMIPRPVWQALIRH